MESNTILAKLQPIFRDILDQPDLTIARDSSARNIEDWDSFAHIVLIRAVEKEFSIKFALNEVGNLKNVGEMADMIQVKLAAQSPART